MTRRLYSVALLRCSREQFADPMRAQLVLEPRQLELEASVAIAVFVAAAVAVAIAAVAVGVADVRK